MKIRIKLSGCDDDTTFEAEVDEAGATLLEMIAAQSVLARRSGCMPIMEIERLS